MKVNKATLLADLEEKLITVSVFKADIEKKQLDLSILVQEIMTIKNKILPRKRTTPKARKPKAVDETEE